MYSNFSNSSTTTQIFNIKPCVLDEPYFSSNFLRLDILKARGNRIVFSRPVFFTLEHNKNGFYAQNKELNVFAYGATVLSLYDDIHDEILSQWALYANELDENMTPDSQRIKNNLRELVALKESSVQHA